MAHAAQWEVLPDTPTRIEAVAERCRRLVSRRALVGAGVAMVPLPGLDWLTDVALLLKLIPEINREFGLTPEQVERLAPDRRVVVYKAITAGGGMLIGRVVTRELVMTLLRVVGVRLTTQQAAKFVPVAGQAVSALLTFSALKYVCEQHIRQCMEVARQLALPAPAVLAQATTLPDMAAIAARFAPTVVNISVTGSRKVSTAQDSPSDPGAEADGAPGADDTDAMRDFLRNFQQRFGGLPPQVKLPVRGEGSGLIVQGDLTRADGHAERRAAIEDARQRLMTEFYQSGRGRLSWEEVEHMGCRELEAIVCSYHRCKPLFTLARQVIGCHKNTETLVLAAADAVLRARAQRH